MIMEEKQKNTAQLLNQSLPTFDNQKENEFRGIISNKNNTYFIINELASSTYTKTFSAIKITLNKYKKVDSVSNEDLCIRYINKAYVQETIFKDLQIPEERVEKYYESLKNSFPKFQNLTHPNLQKLYDFIEDKNGLYFVLDFCEYTLEDFMEMTRGPMRNSKYPIDLKFRKVITDILKCMQYIHSQGLCLCSLINPHEIYIKETSWGQNKSAFQVKLPHPFLAHLFTLLAMKNKSDNFPSFFAPEIYESFLEKMKKNKTTDTFDGLITMLKELDQNFDTWATGYLLYQILYNDVPFKFESIEDANNKFNLGIELTYEIFPWKISYHMLKLISDSLRLDPKKRIQSIVLDRVIKEIEAKNADADLLEKELKLRIERMNKDKEAVYFNCIEDFQAENYSK